MTSFQTEAPVLNPSAPLSRTPQNEILRSTKFPAEFIAGARNAVTTCLRIQPSEKVTLITDERCLTIAASIASELDRIGCKWNGFVLEALAVRPLVDMPRTVLDDMEIFRGEHLRR